MTATRDRRSDPVTDAEPAWDDRPIIGQFRGLPWWAAVVLAFGVSTIAAVVDMQRQNSLGKIYQYAFVLGCVGAVAFVKRRSLFGPMVQPPLVFAITAVGAVAILTEQPSGGGLKGLVLSVALPLTSNFPTMGITTAVVVGIGLFRLWRERDPNPAVRVNKTAKDRAARAADGGFADEPGQGTGGRGPRERPGRDRTGAPPRRGRQELDDAANDDRGGRRMARGGRDPRESGGRDAGGRELAGRDAGGRDAGVGDREARRDARRRDPGERGRPDPSSDSGRGRGRVGESSPRRRDAGADGGRARGERGAGRRDPGREGEGPDSGRDGRGGTAGRQPRRRPPEDYR